MVKSLEEFVAEATSAYAPAKQAVQTQLNGLQGQLDTANETINKNYAQQQAGLNRQRNMAASNASMQAAGSGGSFGGAANIANRKYYDQSFVPAQTQLQTNQANELANTRQYYDNQRTNLNSQLADIDAKANAAALQQYWAAVEAEENRRAQMAAARASAVNPFMYLDDGYSNQGDLKRWDFGNGYWLQQNENGTASYGRGGRALSAGEFLEGTGANGANWDLWNDVWNNGVSTQGVGSDTVSAFNRMSPSDSKYGYLF